MFYIDKYTLKTYNKPQFHQDLLKRLEHMSKNESMPHMLFCGAAGSGKKTIIKTLLEMLFDSSVHKLEDTTYPVYGSGNKVTNVQVKQSDYHIVIEPGSNNFDRYLIQDIVKEYAKKKPMGVFKTKKIFKVVLINNIDNLSYYAQTSLRRTMEKYSRTCRFIMWCTCSTRVIEPLISRCAFFTVASPTEDELFSYIYQISIKERMSLQLKDFMYILNCARGNIKEALWLLQLYKLKYTTNNIYYYTIDVITNMIISHDISRINNPTKSAGIFMRDLLYNIMVTNVSGTQIMKDILHRLVENPDIPDECKYQMINTIAYYEHHIIKSRRNIFHLEAPIIKIMKVLYEWEKTHPEYKAIFAKYAG